MLANMFRALTGSRHRIRERQVTDILSITINSESTPVTNTEVITAAPPPVFM